MSWTPVGRAEVAGEPVAAYRGPGQGPPLVLAHGLEDTWRGWRPFVDALSAARFTCYALDLPWRAGSDYRWSDRVTSGELLAGALRLLPAPAAVLLGHSFGAVAVLEHLAGGDPRPAGAVLLAPHYRPDAEPVTWRLFDAELGRFRQVIADGLRLRLGDRRHTLDPALVDTMVDKALDRVGPLGFLALVRQFLATTDLDLGSVPTPTLVVTGAADPALTSARGAALSRAMPTATVHTRPGGGHFCHIEDAAGVTAEVRRFLTALPVPAAA